jgi:hypothetical protein
METEKKIKKVEIDIAKLNKLSQEDLNKLQDVFEWLDEMDTFSLYSIYTGIQFGDGNEMKAIMDAIKVEQKNREKVKRDTWELAVR